MTIYSSVLNKHYEIINEAIDMYVQLINSSTKIIDFFLRGTDSVLQYKQITCYVTPRQGKNLKGKLINYA